LHLRKYLILEGGASCPAFLFLNAHEELKFLKSMTKEPSPMGKLVIFCAGTSIETLPGEHTDAILINVVNNGSNDKSIKKTKELLRKSKPTFRTLTEGNMAFYVISVIDIT